MPISIAGSGTITGISAGGLPDDCITTAEIAAGAVTDAKVNASAAIADTKLSGTTCKAWVNFNGTGTVAIRASYNVSSITDNAVGNYTVNFTNAMVDANFVCEVSAYDVTGGATAIKVQPYRTASASTQPISATNAAGTTFLDLDQIHVAIFR